jgi:hypothetical protein
VAFQFVSSWDNLSTIWISPAFSIPSNISQNDLTHSVAAAAKTQV